METTVIGVFEDRAKAQNALDALLSVGFGRADVQLRAPEDLPAARGPGLDDASAGGTIGGTFGMQTGLDHPDADTYVEALRRGGCLVVVKSRNDEQHAEIINVLDRFGPVDIDDRVAYWRSEGWEKHDRAAPIYTDDDVLRERTGYTEYKGKPR